MNFKKDYINFVLHSVIQSEFYGVRDDIRARKVLEKIISIPDVAKAAFLAGKTDGLEVLFKYLLYVSDKIDKSQITIFNIKDNFEYDLQNLKRICSEIKNYRKPIKEEAGEEGQMNLETTEVQEQQVYETAGDEELKTETAIPENIQEIITGENAETTEETSVVDEETSESDEKADFTLIENKVNENIEEEVFALTDITRSLEIEESSVSEEPIDESIESEEIESTPDEEIIKEAAALEDIREEVKEKDEIVPQSETGESTSEAELPEKEDFEFEIKKKSSEVETVEGQEGAEKNVSATSEAYYNFEARFFEEVKILEKLFSRTKKECRKKELKKLSERTLQSFTEIIEISNELSNLTGQLQFDLTADIFLTINLLFTKAIKTPSLINPERIELINNSLALVKSLIKDEDYPGYDELVNRMESLKEDINKPTEQLKEEPSVYEETESGMEEESIDENVPEEIKEVHEPVENKPVEQEQDEQSIVEQKPAEIQSERELITKQETPGVPVDGDTSLFKMKYLVKEFEKSFLKLNGIQGEYDKFEILEVVDEVNNLLKMLAKISATVKNTDVLKLSEVTYVFLKYLKDYKMDLLDSEIQQIIKYIIFTYKMLLTKRKPEDFEILVQYLNNPVKIFTDT